MDNHLDPLQQTGKVRLSSPFSLDTDAQGPLNRAPDHKGSKQVTFSFNLSILSNEKLNGGQKNFENFRPGRQSVFVWIKIFLESSLFGQGFLGLYFKTSQASWKKLLKFVEYQSYFFFFFFLLFLAFPRVKLFNRAETCL